MLGRAANGVFWMSRYLERAENIARLLEVGFRLAMTRGNEGNPEEEWRSVLVTSGLWSAFEASGNEPTGQNAFNFVLREKENPASVLAMIENARTNARMVRTSITSEVWETTNESWMALRDALARPVRETNLGEVLALIRRQTTQVRGAIDGTMLRNEIFNFSRLGTFIERADNTARILDVKYYVLLPSALSVGSSFDIAQWDTLLRSVSGRGAYRYLNHGRMTARGIADLLIKEGKFPRSLTFCYAKLRSNMASLAHEYGKETDAHALLRETGDRLTQTTVDDILDHGLHEFLLAIIHDTAQIANAIGTEYRFTN